MRLTRIHAAANDPNVLNVQALRGVTASNEAGTPIDPHAVIDAEHMVEDLRGAQSKCIYFFVWTTTNVLLRQPPGRYH